MFVSYAVNKNMWWARHLYNAFSVVFCLYNRELDIIYYNILSTVYTTRLGRSSEVLFVSYNHLIHLVKRTFK